MLLQSGQHMGVDHVYHISDMSKMPPPPPTILASDEVTRYLDLIQDTLKDGWTVHATKEGRLYYCNHITRSASWLPPAECWTHNIEYPYGWEKAIDGKGRPYYVNHLNKTTTYEVPICSQYDSRPPEPRLVVLNRCQKNGFGFVAGSERPVIVRYVTPDGPSVNHLQPNDQILAVNGEDVKDAPRDHVIQLVRSCEMQVSLLVCQPEMLPCSPGRKSTLLSPARKEKLRNKRPSRVRFAESVCVNGAPLFPPSAFSLGDLHVPQMANVLKVFLENGQTKSFKYDSTTTVRDVVTSLRDKLCLSADEHFSLVLEHVKSLKRNKLTLLDPEETLARIAARPGAHKLRCLFRVTFVPLSAAALAQKDLNSLDYLYMQCCNDVTVERFSPELQPDVALRLAALQIHQHSLANNISPAKLTVKTVEREFGLERFVPMSLIESMKRKELRRLIGHFLKLNQQMTGSSKMLTQLQAKIHYLDIISGLPSYGAKCFSTNARDGIERVLLVSPRFGLSQIPGIRNSVPQTICSIESLSRLVITREDDITHTVSIYMQPDRLVSFMMEDRDALEFSLVLVGYHKLLTGKLLPIDKQLIEEEMEEIAPPFLTPHSVLPSTWNYLPQAHGRAHNMLFINPPPYHSVTSLPIDIVADPNQCDSNMNTTLTNNNHKQQNGVDQFGFDIHSVMTMEILEGTKGKPINGLIETRNEEVLRRVAEMQKMVENSEKYLNEQGELVHECDMKTNTRLPWQNFDFDSDCDSMNSSKQSSNEDTPAPGVLKHSDSLVLLAESINLDLNGITKGLNLIGANGFESTNGGNKSQENTPKPQRKVQGLSQLLSDLHAISNDLSQSESDSESINTPTGSPIHRPQPAERKKVFRTSFGLHSPDSSTLGPDNKDTNLREYLKLLKEASSKDSADIDLAAKKLSELYGFEIGDDTFIESDPDVIDLTAIPPPQTPDELDSLNVLNAAPSGFGDKTAQSDGDLEKFLAQVAIAPPTQKITPAKELTPEEIMSYIIPPPPCLSDDELDGKKSKSNSHHEESLYMNSSKNGQSLGAKNKTIDYATVERKGPFSCCSKNKKDENGMSVQSNVKKNPNLELPPRRCEHKEKPVPPERPPKSNDLQARIASPTSKSSLTNTFRLNGGGNGVYYETTPQKVFPIAPKPASPILSTLPPRKPNLPPVPVKPVFRQPIPLPKMINSDSRIAGIVSPRFQRYPTSENTDRVMTNGNGCTSPPIQLSPRLTNGHFRFNSESPKENGSSVSVLFSPQMNRKLNHEPIKSPPVSANGSPLLESRNGHVINVESLMAKTDLAMAGLLMKLDQIAAQCQAAQSAGGGASIDEEKFQKARNELTEIATQLVTSSKALVATMSKTPPTTLPEHLSACLTALRRITELAQAMTKHTSAPLQTRNIVLKVHDVASSFRELANVQIGPLGAGAQALQAECLLNVLATLIRSLRVFSP